VPPHVLSSSGGDPIIIIIVVVIIIKRLGLRMAARLQAKDRERGLVTVPMLYAGSVCVSQHMWLVAWADWLFKPGP